MQQAQLADDDALRDGVLVTANNICQGGLYDHLAGGFARYSVDAAWLVPHFEKMLYDNAQLIDLLTRLWRTTKNPIYAARIATTIDWLADEMQLPEGGFAASLDADSDGAEGTFYIWTPEEIEIVLGEKTAMFSEAYGVTAEGNFENRNILNRLHAVDAKNTHDVEAGLAEARIALLARRNTRPRPERDDKMLADWNAMTITALAHAAQTFRNADWRDLAIRAFAALERDLCETANGKPTGRLVHSARRVDDTVHQLDVCLAADLAHAAEAAIALYQNTGAAAYLHKAIGWMGSLDSAYADKQRGGYFENDDATPGLLVRNRNVQDNAMPATNAVALRVFAALAQLTGDMGFLSRAEAIRDALAGMMEKNYPSMTALLDAATAGRHPATLVIRTVADDGEAHALVQTAAQHPIVDVLIVELPPGADLPPDHPARPRKLSTGERRRICVRDKNACLRFTKLKN